MVSKAPRNLIVGGVRKSPDEAVETLDTEFDWTDQYTEQWTLFKVIQTFDSANCGRI